MRFNRIAGNDVGVRVAGDTSTTDASGRKGPSSNFGNPSNNRIESNTIVGNQFGVFLDNAPDTVVGGTMSDRNFISDNISIGVVIRGNLATRNLIQNNEIARNRGTTRLSPSSNPQDIGTGVYIERSQGNTVRLNDILGNALVGVYLFDNAVRNPIEKNTINARGGPGPGQYGVFLFNSAGNVFQVSRKGKTTNKLVGASVANFREFTGPVKKTLVPLPQLPGQLPGSDDATQPSTGGGSPAGRGGRNADGRARTGPRRPSARGSG